MSGRTVTTILALACLVFCTVRGAPDEPEKRANVEVSGYPRAANWISARPMRMLGPDNEIGYLLQYLEKRSSIESEGDAPRDIRSPLGTMRFGKRSSPLGTMRFGKRSNPLGTMRFGKRANNAPLGTMRFGKRAVVDFGDDVVY